MSASFTVPICGMTQSDAIWFRGCSTKSRWCILGCGIVNSGTVKTWSSKSKMSKSMVLDSFWAWTTGRPNSSSILWQHFKSDTGDAPQYPIIAVLVKSGVPAIQSTGELLIRSAQTIFWTPANPSLTMASLIIDSDLPRFEPTPNAKFCFTINWSIFRARLSKRISPRKIKKKRTKATKNHKTITVLINDCFILYWSAFKTVHTLLTAQLIQRLPWTSRLNLQSHKLRWVRDFRSSVTAAQLQGQSVP